jgi:hypothetical protein
MLPAVMLPAVMLPAVMLPAGFEPAGGADQFRGVLSSSARDSALRARESMCYK